jgi:cytosine/adenosine deaminase-related metal-dependent hydrolase
VALNFARETWILHANVVTQNARREVRRANVRIIDGWIDAIVEPARMPKTSRFARVIEARDITLLPGFVQAHVHLCQTLFRNQADDLELLDWLKKKIWKMEAAHTRETLYVSAHLGIHELLSSGTTCILDMGTVRHTEAILEAVRETGIRASVGKCLMDNPKTTPRELREPTEAALEEACRLHDRWNGREKDRIRVSFAPRFVVSCTDKLMRAVADEARARKAVVHTHASENRKEIALVKRMFGRENIEQLDHWGLASKRLVLAHCVWLNEREKKILRRTGTHVAHCPGSNLKLASGIAEIPDLKRRGINVALGADGAPCNNNLDMFREMRLAALIHKPGAGPKAMRAQTVLDMATRDGARALSWSEHIGSIEVGKRADIIGLDLTTPSNYVPEAQRLDPRAVASAIVYSSGAEHLRFTMVDGRVLWQPKDRENPALSALAEKALREIHRTMGGKPRGARA